MVPEGHARIEAADETETLPASPDSESGLPASGLIDGKYQIEGLLGRGGMGTVYRVRHLGLDKRFALKIIRLNGPIPQRYRERFETEARALGRARHAHIVDVTDYGVDPRGEGLPYLVMEYLEGKALSEILEERHVLPFPEAVRLLRGVAQAIDSAHRQNIVHGDLKPSNLFLTQGADSAETVKVVDFGLARLAPSQGNGAPAENFASHRESAPRGICGTPAYMAPELFRAEDATPASDRFALGALAYELLTGSPPFGNRPSEVTRKQDMPAAPPSSLNSQVPRELDAPILAMLNASPEQRPESAAAGIRAMETAWLAAEQREWRRQEGPRRLRFAAIGTAAALMVAAAVASMEMARTLENRMVDARFAMMPAKPPDPRLLIVTLDDATLRQDPRLLGERSTDFARMIDQIFGGGASAVAIDILPPETWSKSHEFAAAVTAHADRLALAKLSRSGEVVGPECISPLTVYAIGPDRFSAMFGFVNLVDDRDGKIRRAHVLYQDRDGRGQPSFGARAVRAASIVGLAVPAADRAVWIDYETSPGSIPEISWKDVAARLESAPSLFRNRLVFLGGEFAGNNDEHRVPESVSADPVSGVRIQALIANTILAGIPVRDAALLPYLLAMGVACLATLVVGLRFPHRPLAAPIVAASCFCGYAMLAFAIFRYSRILIPVTGTELAILLSAAAAWFLRLRLKPYPLAKGE